MQRRFLHMVGTPEYARITLCGNLTLTVLFSLFWIRHYPAWPLVSLERLSRTGVFRVGPIIVSWIKES